MQIQDPTRNNLSELQNKCKTSLKRRRRRRPIVEEVTKFKINCTNHMQVNYNDTYDLLNEERLLSSLRRMQTSRYGTGATQGHQDGCHLRQNSKNQSNEFDPSKLSINQVKKAQIDLKYMQEPIKLLAQSTIRSTHRMSFLSLILLIAATISCLMLVRVTQFYKVNCQSVTQFGDIAEPRAEPSSNLKPPQGLAFNQLVSLLNSMNQQSSVLGNNNNVINNQRRSPPPLPLGAIGSRGIQPQAISSTPVNPFAAAAQFQPTRRVANNNNNNNNNNFNGNSGQQLFGLTSPPTLTLNRIASMANGQQNTGRIAFNNNNKLQPINTIPLGSVGNSNNQQPNVRFNVPVGQPVLPLPVTANRQTNGQQLFNQPQHISKPPAPSFGNNRPTQVRPISGFAPSGPPPSSATNNAIFVVQSPPNAIGQPENPSPANKSLLEPIASTETAPESSSKVNLITTTTTTTAPSATSQKNESLPPTTTAGPPSSSEPQAAIANSTTTTTESSSSGSSTSWSPVNQTEPTLALNHTTLQAKQTASLAPTPDIVTVPPGYNPDQPPPDNFDIAVSAQMGGSNAQRPGTQSPAESNSSPRPAETTSSTSSLPFGEAPVPTLAPTAVTTIFWSPPSTQGSTTTTHGPTRINNMIQPTKVVQNEPRTQLPTQLTTTSSTTSTSMPTRIRDNSLLEDEPSAQPAQPADSTTSTIAPTTAGAGATSDSDPSGVVYGKPQARDSKPTGPPPSGQDQQAGRAFIQTAQLDNQVRPYSAGASSVLKSNHGGTGQSAVNHHHQSHAPFKPSKQLNGHSSGLSSSGMHVGSGFTIVAKGNETMPAGDIQDYVAGQPVPMDNTSAHEPTISAHGGPDPASFDLAAQDSAQKELLSAPDAQQHQDASSTSANPTPAPSPRVRRPTFKPKPAVPPIRIDSCIVGDDSSCDQSHNERCVTEYGISSCHCRPGFARLSQLRGYCSPISSLQFHFRIDKLSDERRLAYNHSLENPNSEEYQYLEFETIQAVAGIFQQTSLAKQFMGARVNKFFQQKGKVWANMSINLEANNLTKGEKIQQIAGQELLKVAQLKQRQPIGDSTIMLDGSSSSISRLVDVNECANKELNDCSKHATCTNEFGGFQCQCLPGYEDKHQSQQSDGDKSKQGRMCMGCSASYCSNRGECSIIDGKKQCKCRPNFMGTRCDIDSEVLAVAIGGSLVGIIILIITFWCLFVFNRKWRHEQQKMDAVSATSGLTFNYVNSSMNSLMSPARAIVSGPIGRSAGQRFGLMGTSGNGSANGTRGGHSHYALDQQAIIGSTSSGSSAASQPIACNPYAPGYQYEDAGLLIAPASTGSSEQTSPSSNSYRGIMGNHNASSAMMAAGNAYTLSGHHHHHHHQHSQAHLIHHPHHHHHHQLHHQGGKPLTQFHPAADYRTLNTTNLHCPTASSGYSDTRWRTLQQDSSKQSALVGYYLVR